MHVCQKFNYQHHTPKLERKKHQSSKDQVDQINRKVEFVMLNQHLLMTN